MKKYFFFAAAALLALAACSKVNYVEQPDQRITFSVVNYLNSTKAQGVKYEEPESGFGTYAWWSPDTWEQSPFNTVYINNAQVKKTGNVWSPVDNYYWTKTGTLSFASYSPYKGTGAPEYKPAATEGENATLEGWYYPNYTVVDGTEDLMFADLVTNLTSNVNSVNDAGDDLDLTDDGDYNNGTEGSADSKYEGVPTLFRHALSQIAFQFQGKLYIKEDEKDDDGNVVRKADWPSNVESYSIKLVEAKVVAANNASYGVSSWSSYATTPGEYIYFTNVDLTNGTFNNPVSKILLPQSLVAGTSPIISYPSTAIGNEGEEGYLAANSIQFAQLLLSYDVTIKYVGVEDERTVSILRRPEKLTFGDVDEWEPNQSILYKVTISPLDQDPIKFDPAVVDWNKTVEGTIDIQ